MACDYRDATQPGLLDLAGLKGIAGQLHSAVMEEATAEVVAEVARL